MEPETIVKKQIEAYNARDINAFCSTFSDDISLFKLEELQPYLEGKDELHKVYKEIFESSPNLNCIIKNKMVFENKIIYHEIVEGRIASTLEVIAIYEVKDGLINKLTFIGK